MRTPESQKAYDNFKKSLKLGFCPFHDGTENISVKEWEFFYLTKNKFPREGVKEAWLIIPYRHTNQLNKEEAKELDTIAIELDQENYFVFENIEGLKSVWCKHYHAIKL